MVMFRTKEKFKKALDANSLIHDAIVTGICDKYIAEDNLKTDDFGLQLLERALNWAVPNLNYNFIDDVNKIDNQEFKKKLQQDEDQIFKKGLSILNSDPLIEKLASFYVAYEIYLVDILFPKDCEKSYPGVVRMRKFLFQTTEEPDVESYNFKEEYKNLFVKFNQQYGKYGKTLKLETIESMFSFLSQKSVKEPPKTELISEKVTSLKFEDLSKGAKIKADLYSRPNEIEGRYKAAKIIGLENFGEIKESDVFFLETLQVRANSADKIFAEAKSQGRNLNDPNVMKALGEEINVLGKPIHRSEAVMTAVWCVLQLIVVYAVVGGIWGLVFKKSFFIFGLFGGIAGLLVSALFVAPVVASQRTKQRIQDIVFGAGSLLFIPIIYIGILGLIALVIRLIFF